MLTHQEHPGPAAESYATFEEKRRDAQRYQTAEAIRWTVAIDDIEGSIHQAYGGTAHPAYLIGTDGRIAFTNLWGSAPVLDAAIDALERQGGSGIVEGGRNDRLHLLAAFTDGWRALQRGGPRSLTDLMLAAPGSPMLLWLGRRLRPPLTLRSTRLPSAARRPLGLVAALLAIAVARRAACRSSSRWRGG